MNGHLPRLFMFMQSFFEPAQQDRAHLPAKYCRKMPQEARDNLFAVNGAAQQSFQRGGTFALDSAGNDQIEVAQIG